MSGLPTLHQGSDSPPRRARRAAPRSRRVRVHGVSVECTPTRDRWLLTVKPGEELTRRGVHPLAAQVLRCTCDYRRFSHREVTRTGRCKRCRGRDEIALADIMRRLLRSYPKVWATVPVDTGIPA